MRVQVLIGPLALVNKVKQDITKRLEVILVCKKPSEVNINGGELIQRRNRLLLKFVNDPALVSTFKNILRVAEVDDIELRVISFPE